MIAERRRNVRLLASAAFPTFALLSAIVVIDADTVERAGERWRVAGIDAPEIHGARCPAERQAGILAAARLVTLLAERGGRLIDQGREKYGRRLGRLLIGWPSTGEDDWAALAVREGWQRQATEVVLMDEIRLGSGRVLSANRGLISINANLEIAEGYDGDLPDVTRHEWQDDSDWATADKLSAAEQIELADRMIALWQAFRDRAAVTSP
jgi:hypothetical protein